MTSDSLICLRCGEENRADATACGACHVPMSGGCGSLFEGHRACPRCGESCPREAVMCWACYTPLVGESCAPDSGWAEREAQLLQREAKQLEQIEKARDIARIGLLAGAFVSLFASGYAPQRRMTLLGAGAACLGALVGWLKWDECAATSAPASADEEPTARILDTILLYAVRDGATQVRLRAGIGVRVHYLINGEWQEQMRLPAYVWDMLQPHLIKKTGNWERPLPFSVADKSFEFWPEFKRDFELPIEIVLLTLQQTN